MIPLTYMMSLSAMIFAIGVAGVIIRRNILVMLMSIELMLNAVNLAFIAIGSGTALIFLQITFLEWFSLKMVFVAILVMLHVTAGLILAHLFEPGGHFGRFSFIALTGAYAVLITVIILVVLAKPHIDSNQFATNLFAPGGLRQFLGEIRMPIP